MWWFSPHRRLPQREPALSVAEARVPGGELGAALPTAQRPLAAMVRRRHRMTSEQRAELIGGHADGGEDATQGALEQILAAVDWHGHGTAVRMAHDVVATVDPRDGKASFLQRLDYLRSRHGRDSAGHKPARYYKSGHVECQSEFVRYPDLFDQKLKTGAQVCDRGFPRLAFAEGGNARAKLGGRIPAAAILIWVDGVGHVNDTSHRTYINNFPPRSCRCCDQESGHRSQARPRRTAHRSCRS